MRYLFSEDQEELVGVYASQLERDLCINLFVEMMELRLNSRYCYHMFIWLIVCSLVSVYIIITFGCSLSDIIMQTHVMWVLFFGCSIFFWWLLRSQTGSIWCMSSAIFNEIILQAHIFFFWQQFAYYVQAFPLCCGVSAILIWRCIQSLFRRDHWEVCWSWGYMLQWNLPSLILFIILVDMF